MLRTQKESIIITLLYIIIGIPLQSMAIEKSSRGDTLLYITEPVVVTATKIEGARRDLPVAMTVIQAQEIKSSYHETPLELAARLTPGVFLTERSLLGYGVSSGATGNINVRGVGGSPNSQIMVLIDGRPDFMGMMGHPLPDAYQLDNIEQIEIVRGPASSLYGTNAMGGIINLRTVALKGNEQRMQFRSSFGSYGTRHYHINQGKSFGKYYYYATGGYRETDGHRPWSQAELQNYALKMGYAINPHFDFITGGNLARYTVFNPGPISKPLKDNWVDVQRGGLDLTVQNNHQSLSGSVKVHSNFGNHKIFDGWRSTDNTSGIIVYQNLRFQGGHYLTFGFDVKRYGGDAHNIKTNIDYGEHFITEYAPYLHLNYVVTNKVIASGGVRYDHHTLFGGIGSPSVGLVYQPTSTTAIRGLAARGYRSPTIRELYLFPAPTPTLKPEKMWNYEIGLEQRVLPGIMIDITGFQAKGENLIRVGGSWPRITLSNSGEFTHTGVEIETKMHLKRNLLLNFGMSWLDPDQDTRSAPGKKITANLYYWSKYISGRFDIESIGHLYSSDFRRDRLDNYTIANLEVTLHVSNYFDIYGEVQNLFNKSYSIIYDYPLPGRIFFAGLSLGLNNRP